MEYKQLSDVELVEMLTGKTCAKHIKKGAVTLADIFTVHEAAEKYKAGKLWAFRELFSRFLDQEITREAAHSPASVRLYLKSKLTGLDREQFWALWLDSKNKIISAEPLAIGTLNQCAVYPREVVKRALVVNAGAVIFAHNHPTGSAEPSTADKDLTKDLKEALKVVHVSVLDHFVIGQGEFFSFAEEGLM